MEPDPDKIAYVYGDVCVRKQRRKRQKLLIVELFFDYANNSTLHGLRYIADRGLSIIDKLFWLATFIISIGMCAYLISNVYSKWVNSPVIVTVNERLASAASVPFPSVTICPQIKVKPSIYNFSEQYKNKTNDGFYVNADIGGNDSAKFRNLAQICISDIVLSNVESSSLLVNSSIIDDIYDFRRRKQEYETWISSCLYAETDLGYARRMFYNEQVAPTIYDVFVGCVWNGRANDEICDETFEKVYTAEGLCYTTNSLKYEDIFKESNVQTEYKYMDTNKERNGWSSEAGYFNSENDTYPKRGSVAYSYPDLRIYLRNDPTEIDRSCNGEYSGYKIYLQHPADFPQSSLYYYAALPKQISSLAINFHRLSSDRSLHKYPPEVRQCYFPYDRPLRYFKIYTAKNCQAECLSLYTYKTCHCVGFYMPHDNSSEICSLGSSSCMRDAIDAMVQDKLSDELDLASSKKGCGCLPACDDIEYDAEILKTDYNLLDVLKHQNFSLDDEGEYSRIDLYFKKPEFVTMRRSELFGETDFLANIGGLLGLFLGFSFLSLVEIVYFLTLRIGFTLNRDMRDEKKKKLPKLNE